MARAPQHDWLEEFRQLHVDPSHGGKAPHKPLMLLALLDLVGDRTTQAPQVELTPSLIERFDKYWSIADPQDWQARVWLAAMFECGHLTSILRRLRDLRIR